MWPKGATLTPEAKQWLRALLIAAGSFWAFSPALHGDWLIDDFGYLPQNPLLNDPARLWKIWFAPGTLLDYYPIAATVQLIQWDLWGNETFGYHLTNIVLHICGALLVWKVLAKLGLRFAWLGGLIFAVHPIMVESVAYISEFKNVLSLPFFLLGVCAWIDFEERGERRDYLIALGLFLVAMLCKITFAPFPLVILLYAWWKRGRIGLKDAAVSVPFWVISVGLGLMTIWTGDRFVEVNVLRSEDVALAGMAPRLALGGSSIAFYFWKCLWPMGLLPIYPQWKVDPPSPLQFVPWVMLVSVTVWCWVKRAGWGRHVLLGLGFFLIMLGPFIGLHTISYMSFTWVMDHLVYVPILGLIGLAVAGLGVAEARMPVVARPYGIGAVAVVIAIMACGSRAYSREFVDQKTLWTYTLERNPMAWPALENLGAVRFVSGDVEGAKELYLRALQIQPTSPDVHSNLGLALMKEGRFPEALEQFEIVRKARPNGQAHAYVGDALMRMGKTAEALGEYQQALKVEPGNARTHFQLGNFLAQTGHLPEALVQFEEAIRANPNMAEAQGNLGNVYLQMNEVDRAITAYQAALSLNPNNADVHSNLGSAYVKMGQIPAAIEEYEKALAINPEMQGPRMMLERLKKK